MKNNQIKKIVLSGGGTAGSVTPLLAIVDEFKKEKLNNYEFLWIGTKKGLEEKMVQDAKIKFIKINSGKLRRYFSFRNFSDIFLIIFGFFQSLIILIKYKPNLMISAGGFVSVPVAFASWILHIPILIHQQDACPGLANKIMSFFAKKITVTFKKSLNDYNKKAIWIGNPIRNNIEKLKTDKKATIQKIRLNNKKPIILVIGGGTGSLFINNLITKNLEKLIKFCQIIHITGKNKNINFNQSSYKIFEFLDSIKMAKVYAIADVVVSRCGMGVLTELSYLGKPSILIPMPNSHQEDNAKIFQESNSAIILNQEKISGDILEENIKKILNNKDFSNLLSKNIKKIIKRNANSEIKNVILQDY